MKNKKLAIFVVICLVVVSFFAGCTASSNNADSAISPSTITAEAASPNSFDFERVYIRTQTGGIEMEIFREITTDVLYLSASDYIANGYGIGLTVMLNPETGKPLTYSDWKANYAK